MVEALVLKIPVIGSNRGGIPEVLVKNSIIKDVYDIDDWVQKIKDVLVQEQKYLDIDLSKFDHNLQIDNFQKVLDECLNKVTNRYGNNL